MSPCPHRSPRPIRSPRPAPARWLAVLALLAVTAMCAPTASATTTCSAGSPTAIAFGTVSPTGSTDASVTFDVTCNTFGLSLLANAKVRMCLNIADGASGGGNVAPRRMLDGFADPLQFQLYTDAARSQVWGANGVSGAPNPAQLDFDYAVPVLGGSQTLSITLYGRVPAQTFTAGSYANAFTGSQTSIDFRYDETLLGTAAYPPSCTSGGDGGGSVGNAFPFTATATVPAECRAYAASNLAFGTIPGLIATHVDQDTTFSMTCTGRTAWNVGLDDGLNAGGGVRRMRRGAGSDRVAYELYTTGARNVRWGDTIGTDTVTGTGTGSAQSLVIHGRIPAPQSVPAGSYSDTVTVTITY
jgi:spore coat protein U-like protein